MLLTVDREGGVLRRSVFSTRGCNGSRGKPTNEDMSLLKDGDKRSVASTPVGNAFRAHMLAYRMNQMVGVEKSTAANTSKEYRSTFGITRFFSPALVILDVPVVRVVRSVRYSPAVVRDHDEGVRQVTWRQVGRQRRETPCEGVKKYAQQVHPLKNKLTLVNAKLSYPIPIAAGRALDLNPTLVRKPPRTVAS